MSNQTELEAALFLLKDFLEREKQRERQGITLEAVYDSVNGVQKTADRAVRMVETVTKDQIATNLRLDRYGRRLRVLERRRGDSTSEPPSDPADDDAGDTTGKYRAIDEQRAVEIASQRTRLDALENERRYERKQANFWRDWKAKLVAAVVIAMFVASCSTAGGLITYYATGGHK
jgi:hypothetical protein